MTRFSAEITTNAEAIAKLTSNIFEFLGGAGVDARAIHHVGLVIDEILTNVGTHGGNDSTAAAIAIDVHPDHIAAEIADYGHPFDPSIPVTIDTESSVEERKIGGLGLHLVRQLTSGLGYRHDGKRNRTTFCIPREQRKAEYGSQ
jgi:serine/threonine-protein kinase RsbW